MSGKSSKRIFALFIAATTFSTSFSTSALAEAPYRLAYRFQSGEFLHYEMEDRSELFTRNAAVQDKYGDSPESKSFQQTQLLKSYRVVSVDENGGAILEPIVEKVRMSSKSGENAIISFDSTKDEVPPKEFEKIAGTTGRALSRFHVAANGKLIKVKMLVDDVPKSFAAAAEKADPSINFLVVFPEKEIDIGDKWIEKFETPVSVGSGLNRQIQLIRTFELTKVVDQIATIRIRTSRLTPVTDPEILTQLVQQTPTGMIEFDLEQGRILSRSFEINNNVVGAFGPKTLLEARGKSVERLLIEKPTVKVSSAAPNQSLK